MLENDFQAELSVKRFAEAQGEIISAMQSAANEAKTIRAISEVVVWRRQVQDIEHVEHFEAELGLYALGDRSVFDYRKVDGLETRTIELFPFGRAEGPVRVWSKSIKVKPLVFRESLEGISYKVGAI